MGASMGNSRKGGRSIRLDSLESPSIDLEQQQDDILGHLPLIDSPLKTTSTSTSSCNGTGTGTGTSTTLYLYLVLILVLGLGLGLELGLGLGFRLD